jgi:hypothetical protein
MFREREIDLMYKFLEIQMLFFVFYFDHVRNIFRAQFIQICVFLKSDI